MNPRSTRTHWNDCATLPGLTVYGEPNSARRADCVGVVPFTVAGVPPALVAAILGYEGGIGVRSGCFCAQSYVRRLLGLDADGRTRWQAAHLAGDRSQRPGMVRVSVGAYNTIADVDALVEVLERIERRVYRGAYGVDIATGDYRPQQDRRQASNARA